MTITLASLIKPEVYLYSKLYLFVTVVLTNSYYCLPYCYCLSYYLTKYSVSLLYYLHYLYSSFHCSETHTLQIVSKHPSRQMLKNCHPQSHLYLY